MRPEQSQRALVRVVAVLLQQDLLEQRRELAGGRIPNHDLRGQRATIREAPEGTWSCSILSPVVSLGGLFAAGGPGTQRVGFTLGGRIIVDGDGAAGARHPACALLDDMRELMPEEALPFGKVGLVAPAPEVQVRAAGERCRPDVAREDCLS